MLAEDAVSESFLRLMKKQDKIELDINMRTANFLVILCRNVAKDMYRKRAREDRVFYENEDYVIQKTAEDVVISHESVNRIVDVVLKMDSKYRDTIILSKYYGMSRRDIGDIFGITEEAVTKRLQRAKVKIKEAMRKEEE